jgi:hypothetical protein
MQPDARRAAEAPERHVTRPYSLAFKQKMIERLTGKEARSAAQLSRQTGVRQQNLSRWLQEARSLPLVSSRDVPGQGFTLKFVRVNPIGMDIYQGTLAHGEAEFTIAQLDSNGKVVERHWRVLP